MSIAQYINGLIDTAPLPRAPGPVYLPEVPPPPPPRKPRGRPRKHPVPTAPPTPSKAFPGRRVAGSKARIKKRVDPLTRRTKRLTLYLTPVAEAALRRAAHRGSVTMSVFIQDCLRVGIMIACPREEWPEDRFW